MFRSLRTRAGVLAVAALFVGLPVLGASSPASASPDGCASFQGSLSGVTSFDLGTFTFAAGDQLVVSASNPVSGATDFNFGDPNLLGAASVPGTINYTVPATVTANFLGGLLQGTPAEADFSWSCSPALSQTISFTNAPATGVIGGSYVPSATASSTLPVTFTLDGTSTGCLLSAGTVSFTGLGTCVVDADQSGGGNYAPAPTVQGSTVISAPCTVGSYSATGGTPCTLAPPGSFVNTTGATQATLCLPGKFNANFGAANCQPAAPGTYVDVSGATQSTQCALGTFSASPGASLCTPAPPGSDVEIVHATQATLCSKGTFSAAPGASLCTPAPPGSVVSVTGALQAVQCDMGTFSASPGAQLCTPAPAGSFVNTTGATQATQCLPGTFSAAPGAQLCTQAPAGSFVNGAGATHSNLCGLGTFSAAPGAQLCTQAPIGSFVDILGATSASQCPSGTTTTTPGASACVSTQQSQTISFGPLGSVSLGSAPFSVSATATSGLPVSFASLSPTVCTVSGTTVTIAATGLCTIQASQIGSSLFLPAVPVQQSFIVGVPAGGVSVECEGPALTAPTHPSSAPGNGSATVSWFPTQYAAPFGCVAGYVVTPTLNGVVQPPVLILGGGTTTVLRGLTNGGVYTFTFASEDGTVIGPASTPTAGITVGTPTAATALRITHVARHAISVAFKSPNSNGAPITKYTATCRSSNGGVTRSVSRKAGPLTVTGLTPGKTYACTVTATNRRGTGASARSGLIKT